MALMSSAWMNARVGPGGRASLQDRSRVIVQRELVAEDVMAVFLVHGRLAAPALAGHFAGDRRFSVGDRLGQHGAQVEIAAYTLLVHTVHEEHGLCVFEVGLELDLAVAGDALRVEVAGLEDERLQLRIFLGEARRLGDPLGLLLAVFGAWCGFVLCNDSVPLSLNSVRV